MEIKKIKIEKAEGTGWEWPVKVSVATSKRPVGFSKWYDAPFSDVALINAHSDKDITSNILLFNSFREVSLFFKQLNPSQTINAVLILVNEQIDFFNRPTNDWTQTDKLSKKWAKSIGAGGLYYIHTALDFQAWYGKFISQLSYNKGAEEALQALKKDIKKARCYIAPDLDERTKLSYYAETLAKKLLDPSIRGDHNLEIQFPGEETQKMNFQKIGKYLLKNANTLPYNDGEKIADTLRKITNKINSATQEERYTVYVQAEQREAGAASRPKIFALEESGNEMIAEFGDEAAQEIMVSRYLRAAVCDKQTRSIVDSFLLPDNRYTLSISIGSKSEKWLNTDDEIPVAAIFEDKTLQAIDIDLEIRTNIKKKAEYKRLSLPRTGDSNIVSIDFTTKLDLPLLEADIFAYYGSKLIQHIRYSIAISAPHVPPILAAPELKTIVSLRQNLDDLPNSSPFSTSIYMQKNANVKIPGMHRGKPVGLRYTNSVANLVKEINETIENTTLISSVQTALHDEVNVQLLIKLANLGYRLFLNFFREMELNGPLQLLSNRAEYLPIDYAYSFQPPFEEAKLCTHAKEALLEGKCCGHMASGTKQCETVCPFGFWGLRQIVERHQFPKTTAMGSEDFILQFEPDSSRAALEILGKTMYASTTKVNAVAKNSYAVMQNVLKQNIGSPQEATSWKTWLKTINEIDVDTLVLVVHVEPDDNLGGSKLEIATEDFLNQTKFITQHIYTKTGRPAPFVVLIGCEITDTANYLFDTVSSVLLKGAAITLSNATSIRGETATKIVSELVTTLRKVAGKEIRFGEVVLQLRQQLLAQGIMESLTLIAHGDADWKIKVS